MVLWANACVLVSSLASYLQHELIVQITLENVQNFDEIWGSCLPVSCVVALAYS
jgi:hypothetical protein